jgi:hypothetical protein
LVSFYGAPPAPDPQSGDAALLSRPDGRGILAWMLSLTKDSFGNRIEYSYDAIKA